MQSLLKRWILYSIGILVLWNLLTRRPHRAYTEYNGQLIPIQSHQGFNSILYSPSYDSSLATPYNYNPYFNSQSGTYQAQYYPSRSSNQPPPGYFQSNYAPPQ